MRNPLRVWLAWSRMGSHERARVSMRSDPRFVGNVYCFCDRCERDAAYVIPEPDLHSPRAVERRALGLGGDDSDTTSPCPQCGSYGHFAKDCPDA